MSDEELVRALRNFDDGATPTHEAADRIEQLINLNEALVELLEAARADAKEAEAYAEELEEKLRARTAESNHANDVTDAAIEEVNRLKALLATCEKYRDAYDKMGRIGTEAYRELEAKLAKAVEAVSLTVRADNLRETYHALPNDHNRIGDKRSRKGRAREAWLRAFRKAAKTSRATLAEIEGEKT